MAEDDLENCKNSVIQYRQERRLIARKQRYTAGLRFGLKLADIHYKFNSSQTPKDRLQSIRHTGAKQNLT